MKIFLLLGLALFTPPLAPALAIVEPEVVINEIAWMGTTNSANDEWIELKNTTDQEINLPGWLLKTTDGKLKIYLTGKIPSRGFYLLERTDDGSVPNIAADQIYTGALSNTGLSMELSRNSQTLIDTIAFTGGWPAGDNTAKQTMERTSDGQWQTSQEPNGTPKTENSKAQETTPKQVPPDPVPAPMQQVSYPEGITISEVMPSPEGADDTGEWVELHNSNTFAVNLAGWKIQDTEGTITTYAIKEAAISPQGYVVFGRLETNITLNNELDGLKLLQPNNKIADTVSYSNAPNGQSYSKANSAWHWSGTNTPDKANIITAAPSKTSKKALPKKTKSDNSRAVASAVSGISPELSQSLEDSGSSPWLLFFIALGIAIISAVALLFVKFKLFNHVRS